MRDGERERDGETERERDRERERQREREREKERERERVLMHAWTQIGSNFMPQQLFITIREKEFRAERN